MKPFPFHTQKLAAFQRSIDIRTPFLSTLFLFGWMGVTSPMAGADKPLMVEIWPGTVPEESGVGIGPERFRMSPSLDRKQVEVTEPTQMVTDVTKPTITGQMPPEGCFRPA